MSKSKSWLRTLIDLLEVFFNSSQRSKRGRTWHQHVVPYEEGWAIRREVDILVMLTPILAMLTPL